MAGRKEHSRGTPARTALRIAGSVARWIAVAVLSVFYYATSAGLLGFGVACTWNGVGPGNASELAYPVAGVIMLITGIIVFVFFPRIVKKLTGREILSSPYGVFGSGGGDGGNC